MEKYVGFIRKLVSFVNKHMDFGERGCPFCGNHFIHTDDCLYRIAVQLLPTTEGD